MITAGSVPLLACLALLAGATLQLSLADQGVAYLKRVQEGDDVILTCSEGGDVTWYTWGKDGRVLMNRTRQSTFSIGNVSRASSGLYWCATKGSVAEHATIELVVQYAPEIAHSLTSLRVDEGDIGHLVCTTRGEPCPKIQWHYSGRRVHDSWFGVALLDVKNTSANTLSSHLLAAVAGGRGTGEYSCVATNELGTSERTFVIQGISAEQANVSLLSLTDQTGLALGVGLTLLLLLAVTYYIRKRAKFLEQHTGLQTADHNLTTLVDKSSQSSSTCSDDDNFEESPWMRRALLPAHVHKTRETGV